MVQKLRQNRPVKAFLGPGYHLGKYVFSKVFQVLEPPNTAYLTPRALTPKTSHCFFGYYDKCPWDTTGQYMLCLKTPFARRMPRPHEPASVCIIDLENDNQMREIAETTAWCWQQGCMLQWYGEGADQYILYNDFLNGYYVTVVCDRDGKMVKILQRPTYAVSKDGRKILSLNFARLHYCRPGYGYVGQPFPERNFLSQGNDGIFLVDTGSGESRLIISLDQITKISPREEFPQSIHYFNHIEFNPSSTRFVFYHRWKSKAGSMEKTRMYTAAPDGSDMYCLSDHGIVSHYTWKDDNHLLAWAAHPLAGQKYYLYEDKTNHVTVVGDGVLTEDGHPSYSSDDRWILTDTYPNSRRCRDLLLFDTRDLKRYDLGRFFVPYAFDGPIRCDLHPRWSPNGEEVCFDSVHEGKRRMYTMDVSSLVSQ